MKLSQGNLISPSPIRLSIGTLRKPTLRDISDITFDKYDAYTFYLSMNVRSYYTVVREESGGKEYWDSLSAEIKNSLTIYDALLQDEKLREEFLEILNWFFIEPVVFVSPYFALLNKPIENTEEIQPDDVEGVISKETFDDVLDLIRQICGITKSETPQEEPQFKNELARKMYEKIQKAKQTRQKEDNFTLVNIIDSVNGFHRSLNYTNIWGLTVQQLIRTFNRLRQDEYYYIDRTRVSVWGDEKKTFDDTLWFKGDRDG